MFIKKYLNFIDHSNQNFKLIFGFLFILINIGLQLYHEPWRDEIEALSIFYSSQDFISFINNASREGHGLLYYILIYILGEIFEGFLILQIINFLFYISTIFLLVKIKNITNLIFILILTSHFFIWEYFVVARSYSILVFLSLLTFYLRNINFIFICLGFLANTEIYGLIVVSSYLFFYIGNNLMIKKFNFVKTIHPLAFSLFIFLIIVSFIPYINTYTIMTDDNIHVLSNRLQNQISYSTEILKIFVNLTEGIFPIKASLLKSIVYGFPESLEGWKKVDNILSPNLFIFKDYWMKGGYSFSWFDVLKLYILLIPLSILLIIFNEKFKVFKFSFYTFKPKFYTFKLKVYLGNLKTKNFSFFSVKNSISEKNYYLTNEFKTRTLLLSIILFVIFLLLFPETQQFRHLGFIYIILIIICSRVFLQSSNLIKLLFLLILIHPSIVSILSIKIYTSPLSDSKSVVEKINNLNLKNDNKIKIYAYPFYIAQNYEVLGNNDIKVFECNKCNIGGVFAADIIIEKNTGNLFKAKKVKIFDRFIEEISKNPDYKYILILSDLYRGGNVLDVKKAQSDKFFQLILKKNTNLIPQNLNINDFKILYYFNEGIVIDEHSVMIKYEKQKL